MVTRYEAFYLYVIGLNLNLVDHYWCSIQDVSDLIWISNEQHPMLKKKKKPSSLLALIGILVVSIRIDAKDWIILETWTAAVSESSVYVAHSAFGLSLEFIVQHNCVFFTLYDFTKPD